ncbi:hypothetical protein, partial [Pontibacter rugosus]
MSSQGIFILMDYPFSETNFKVFRVIDLMLQVAITILCNVVLASVGAALTHLIKTISTIYMLLLLYMDGDWK